MRQGVDRKRGHYEQSPTSPSEQHRRSEEKKKGEGIMTTRPVHNFEKHSQESGSKPVRQEEWKGRGDMAKEPKRGPQRGYSMADSKEHHP